MNDNCSTSLVFSPSSVASGIFLRAVANDVVAAVISAVSRLPLVIRPGWAATVSSTATMVSVMIVVVLACAKSTVCSACRKAFNALPSGRLVEMAPGSLANHSTATSTRVPSAICKADAGAPG